MPVRQDHGVEGLLPPDVDVAGRVVFPQSQPPLLGPVLRSGGLQLRDILYRGVEDQQVVRLVRREVVLDVLPRYIVWRERAVGEAPVREAHGDVGDVSSGLPLVSNSG